MADSGDRQEPVQKNCTGGSSVSSFSVLMSGLCKYPRCDEERSFSPDKSDIQSDISTLRTRYQKMDKGLSPVCDITGYEVNNITWNKLDESDLDLYRNKAGIEKHPSVSTNDSLICRIE